MEIDGKMVKTKNKIEFKGKVSDPLKSRNVKR